jgi:predicted lipoprotein with Yx(FWY)xxD motif
MSIRWAIRGVLLAALAPVGVAACGSSGESTSTPAAAAATATATAKPAQPATQAAKPAAAKGPASLKLGQSRLGPILVDASGRTLYLFTQDKPHRALCTSDYLNCTKIWLPVMTTGRPHGEAGVKAGLLGSFHRTKPSGSQVTYNGHPLYLSVDDKQPGDLKGQAQYDYWYVLSASGRPITRK